MSLSKIKRDFLPKGKITQSEYKDWTDSSEEDLHKFLPWMVSQWLESEKAIPKEELIDLTRSFQALSDKSLIKNKDIHSYNFEELSKEIESKKGTKSRSEEKKEIKTKGAERLEERDGIYLYRIDSHQACVEYGKGTKWCITEPNKEQWNEYTEEGLLQFYFIINTRVEDRDPQSKIAITVEADIRGSIIAYNAEDKEIDLEDYLSKWDIKDWKNVLLPFSKEELAQRLEKEREDIIGESEWDEEAQGYHYKGDLELWGKIKSYGANSIREFLGSIRLLSVSGDFDCSDNELKSLEGAPQFIGGTFYCSFNDLKSLEGSPKIVGGSFYCHDNNPDLPQEEIERIRKAGIVKGKIIK